MPLEPGSSLGSYQVRAKIIGEGGMGEVAGQRIYVAGVLAGLLLLATPAEAERRLSLEALVGGVHNFGTTLIIRQKGEPDIDVDASYDTRAFEFPIYYALRLRIFQDTTAWEVQFVHHKIHLVNVTDEVQHFEVSHGFNLLTVNRAWSTLPLTVRFGAGVVIAHTESVVRDLSAPDTGYHLAGPAFIAGIGREFPLSSRLFVTAEAQRAVARAKVPVAVGDASVPTVGLHGRLGFGFRL